MRQYVKSNATAATAGLLVWLAIDATYVMSGGSSSNILEISTGAILLFASVGFLWANWRLVDGAWPTRVLKSVLLSLPPFLLWLLIGTLTILWFHPFIGGSE